MDAQPGTREYRDQLTSDILEARIRAGIENPYQPLHLTVDDDIIFASVVSRTGRRRWANGAETRALQRRVNAHNAAVRAAKLADAQPP